MFIFHWLFGLFGLLLSLLLLPLRLLGLPLAMVMMLPRLLLRFIARNTMLVVFLVLALLVFLHFKDNKSDLPELTPAPAGSAQQGAIPLVEPVLKQENGDSDFATDLYALMTDDERIQYSKHFYWAMNSAPDGKVYTWSFYNIAGSLRANDTFTNNSGVRCRHFSEGLKVHTIQQTLTGTTCEQGNGTWCKLKPNATAACGLSGNGSFFGGISRALGNLF